MILLRHGTADIAVDVLARRPDLVVSLDGVAHRLAARPAGPAAFALVVDGVPHEGHVYADADAVHVRHAGRTTVFTRPRRAGGGAAAAADEITAEMPGIVVAVHCVEGDAVAAGATLVTIESMKLQMALPAPRDGVVARIHHAAEAAFERGAVLVSLEPGASGAPDGART